MEAMWWNIVNPMPAAALRTSSPTGRIRDGLPVVGNFRLSANGVSVGFDYAGTFASGEDRRAAQPLGKGEPRLGAELGRGSGGGTYPNSTFYLQQICANCSARVLEDAPGRGSPPEEDGIILIDEGAVTDTGSVRGLP
jgi:hypothetical protein